MGELGRKLGTGKDAEVFEYREQALKLFRSGESKAAAFREAANLALLERLELPAPRVHSVGNFDGRWGLVMDRAVGPSFAERMVTDARSDSVREMARLHRTLHEKPGSGLPSLKMRLQTNIRQADGIDPASRERLLRQLDALPVGERLCHGDFHPWNIHGTADGVRILDWLDASCGHPAADVCRSYVLIQSVDPVLATDYLGAYVRLSGVADSEIMAWLQVTAAARLAEGISAETDNLRHLAGLPPLRD